MYISYDIYKNLVIRILYVSISNARIQSLFCGGRSRSSVFSRRGDSRLRIRPYTLKYSESKGANHWNEALYQASKGGHLDIVKYVKRKLLLKY